MAICNLFNPLNKETGNFLLFSPYAENLSAFMTSNGSFKVVPSKFVVCDITYNINITGDLNKDIPEFLQDYVENGFAIYKGLPDKQGNELEVFKNIFWDGMIKIGLQDPNIKYIDKINIQSYNNIKGMGYNEIYCYIPSEAPSITTTLNKIEDPTEYVRSTSSLEGYPDKLIPETIDKSYHFNTTYTFGESKETSELKYTFNTIILLCDIENEKDIPMGIYFTGKFDGNQLNNPVTKFVTDSSIFGAGTSYGLRICTRYTATSNNDVANTEIEITQDNYSAFCQAMTKMEECLAEMKQISKDSLDKYEEYKNSIIEIKNNRTNVPYMKTIAGIRYWFVNGSLIGPVDKFE